MYQTPQNNPKIRQKHEEEKVKLHNPMLVQGGHPVIMERKVPKILPFLKPYEHGPFLQVT
jgi:hypothetical protein